jgi:Domain of unknown function (DUF4124)
MKHFFRGFVWLLVAALPLAAGAQAYRWVDDKGQVHYSQVPPPGRDAQAVGPATPPSAAPNQDSLNDSLKADEAGAPQRAKDAERAAQNQAALEQYCRQTREQLAYMEAKTARRLGTTDDKGNVSRVSEEEFQQRRAELQRALSERCS